MPNSVDYVTIVTFKAILSRFGPNLATKMLFMFLVIWKSFTGTYSTIVDLLSAFLF